MQTFLISPDFTETAKVLDNQRLNKQIIEAGQIFQVVTGKSKGWENHPAVKQWMGYDKSLIDYYLSMYDEAIRRKMNPFLSTSIHEEFKSYQEFAFVNPDWTEDERVHVSHKSRLMFKGRVDAVCYSLRSFLRVRSINKWLKTEGYPEKNVFKKEDLFKLEDYAEKVGCPIRPNHYAQFNWDVPFNLPYFWPTKNL